MWYFYLCNAVLCRYMGSLDAEAVNENRPQDIKHWRNGLIHLAASSLLFLAGGWGAFFAGLFEAVIVFDISYNLFHNPKLSPFYLPIKPKSIKDKIEKIVFFNSGLAAKITYLIGFIICIYVSR